MSSAMTEDAQCLDQFVRDRSELAFRELVGRHLALVHSTARRITRGNVPLAQDVTQVVFSDLARQGCQKGSGFKFCSSEKTGME